MGNISVELEKSLNRLGIKRQVDAVGVVEKVSNYLGELFPREDFEVISFNRGTVKIATKSGALASEIQAQAFRIKNISEIIKRVRIIIV
jgi:hypothetical protein